MKILYAADQFQGYHREVGGAESAIGDIITHLSGGNFQAEIGSRKPDVISLPETYPFWPIRTVEGCNRILPLGRWQRVKNAGWAWDPLAYYDFNKILKHSLPDLIHFGNLAHLSFGPLLAAKKRGIPCVFSVFDYWCCCPLNILLRRTGEICTSLHGRECAACLATGAAPAQWLIAKILRRRPQLFKSWLNRFDAVVVLSENSREILQKAGVFPERLHVIPLYSPEGHWERDGVVPLEKEILFVGWAHPHKGLLILIAAMQRLRQLLPDFKLRVIGNLSNASYLRQVQELIASSDLGSAIEIMGPLSRNSVQDRLRKAWVVAVPEQWPNMSPVIIAEALACGTPVVASRVGGVPDLIEDGINGFLVNRAKPEEMADALVRICQNLDLRNRLSQAGRLTIEKKRNPVMITRLWNDLYQTLASGEPQP